MEGIQHTVESGSEFMNIFSIQRSDKSIGEFEVEVNEELVPLRL